MTAAEAARERIRQRLATWVMRPWRDHLGYLRCCHCGGHIEPTPSRRERCTCSKVAAA